MIGKTTSIKYYWNCNNFWVRNINISPRVTFLYLTLKKLWYLWWRYSSGCTVKNYKLHWWVSCQVQRNSKFCLRENFIKYSMWGTTIFKGLLDIRFHRSQSERHIVANLERHWINQFTLKGIQYSYKKFKPYNICPKISPFQTSQAGVHEILFFQLLFVF